MWLLGADFGADFGCGFWCGFLARIVARIVQLRCADFGRIFSGVFSEGAKPQNRAFS